MILIPKATAERLFALVETKGLAEKLGADPFYSALCSARRWGKDALELQVGASRELIDLVHAAAKEADDRPTQLQASQVLRALDNPDETKISNLRGFPDALLAWARKDLLDGWLYRRLDDDLYMPYLLRSTTYHAGNPRDKTEPSVSFDVVYYGTGGERHRTGYTLHPSDVLGKTMPEIMAHQGFFHENEEFRTHFHEAVKCFEAYVPMLFKQFTFTGKAIHTEHRYGRNPAVSGKNARIVLDKPKNAARAIELLDHSAVFRTEDDKREINATVPYWPYLYAFVMDKHQHAWVCASRIVPYKYKPELRNKLILPDHHRDLIEVLTESTTVLADDIVEGKNGGTIVLCRGKPGLGKTLSAEIVSEIVERPLYRVHSGQLGTKAEEIEKNLEVVMDRAIAFNAILLIDECETFLATRGNSVEQNAITGVFLRTLEYWNGLLFMTTNRADDIDDAILSRCTAVIGYEMPKGEELRQIWTVLAKQFDVELSGALIGDLMDKFPNVSGRDVKNLLRLTKRYAEFRKKPYSVDLFRQCAQFRGL